MSKLSQAIARLSALRELLARAREQIPHLGPLLEALAADEYERAWQVFRGWGDVAAVIDQAPGDLRPYIESAGPWFMRMLDSAVDEAALQRFLERTGLLPPQQ